MKKNKKVVVKVKPKVVAKAKPKIVGKVKLKIVEKAKPTSQTTKAKILAHEAKAKPMPQTAKTKSVTQKAKAKSTSPTVKAKSASRKAKAKSTSLTVKAKSASRKAKAKSTSLKTKAKSVPYPYGLRQARYTYETEYEMLNTLKRIEGQVRSIGRMIENNIFCDDIMDQIASIKAGMDGLRYSLLEEHLRNHVVKKIEKGKLDTIVELMTTIKKMAK